jgi:hypothetical protein
MTTKLITKQDLQEVFNLHKKVTVVFTKKDGTERTMHCTTRAIPEEFLPTEEPEAPGKPTPDHLFKVFDLEAKGWRSFTIANVISFTPSA